MLGIEKSRENQITRTQENQSTGQQKRDWEERTSAALSPLAKGSSGAEGVLGEAGVNPSPSAAPLAPQREAVGAKRGGGITQQVPGSARGGSRR